MSHVPSLGDTVLTRGRGLDQVLRVPSFSETFCGVSREAGVTHALAFFWKNVVVFHEGLSGPCPSVGVLQFDEGAGGETKCGRVDVTVSRTV